MELLYEYFMDVWLWIAILALKGRQAFPQVKVNSPVMLHCNEPTYHDQASLGSSAAAMQQPELLAILVFSKVHIASAHFFCHDWCYACIINKTILKHNFLSEHNPQLKV